MIVFLSGLFAGLFLGTPFGILLAALLIKNRAQEVRRKPPPVRELTEDEKRALERQRRQLDNFMRYNGDCLPDPRDPV